MTITDETLTYTPLGLIQFETIINIPEWSQLMTHKIIGEDVIIEPNSKMDGRTAISRFQEIISLAIEVKIQAARFNLVSDPIAISTTFTDYVPRISSFLGHPVWTAPDNIYQRFLAVHPELESKLFKFPRVDIPRGVGIYTIANDLSRQLLATFSLTIDREMTFTIVNQLIAQVNNGNLAELTDVLKPVANIKLELKETDVIIHGMRKIKSFDGADELDVPSYDTLIEAYILIKRFYGGRVQFRSIYHGSETVKIIKNTFWASDRILAVLRNQNLLDVKSDRKIVIKSGINEIVRVPINNIVYDKLKAIFGEGLVQHEFRVRFGRKAEITGTKAMLDAATDLFDDEIIRVLQRTITSISFEVLTPATAYAIMMKIYFHLKYDFPIVLISELNPAAHTVGIEAMAEIGQLTDFGQVGIVMIANRPYLTGNQQAIDVLVSTLPTFVSDQIVLEDIADGLVGRRLLPKAFSYVKLLLD